MNQPADVVRLAKPFLDIVGFSLVPLVIFQAYKQFADGMSETKYSMYATIYGNIINVVINALLVFGLFMFPKNGNCWFCNWNINCSCFYGNLYAL